MWFTVWHSPPSWILYEINFATETSSGASFSVPSWNLVWIHLKMTELLPFNWLPNGGRRHIGFLRYLNFDGKPFCRTPFSTTLSNSVQICAIMAELWPNMWPPSWSLSDTSSEGKSCPGTLVSVSVSNLVQIRSKMAELWPFNWFQNGGRRHLGVLHYVNFDGNLSAEPHFQPLFQIRCKCMK